MPRPQAEAPQVHLERARDCEGRLKSCLLLRLLARGVAGQGVVVEGVKEVK
jgi:hypothetical protein